MVDEKSLSASMARRRSLPSPMIFSYPIYSSKVCGPRMRLLGKRGFAFQAFVHGMVKEIVGHGEIILFIMKRDSLRIASQ
jgi:hypothetical protein